MNLDHNNQGIADEQLLLKPSELLNILPLDEIRAKAIYQARETISAIIQGKDPRLLVVIGPCSLHDEAATLDYAQRLARSAQQFSQELFIVMRTYFSKPRTSTGWKGIIYDPLLDGSAAVADGLLATRKILLELNKIIPAAAEFLDTVTPCYLSDLISWCAIGARTSASQIHRELASGLAMPVGFKNSVDGNVQIAIDAVKVASQAQHYIGLNSEALAAAIRTRGNQAAHIILRGSQHQANYYPADIDAALAGLSTAKIKTGIMIDCSHDNCCKNYAQQARVVKEIALYLSTHRHRLCGVMIESNLAGGKQAIGPRADLVYGQSITDPCLSWEETEPLLADLATAVRISTNEYASH